MSEQRIALIMGGGVSLGSFSAGALWQVVNLLEHVERGPARIDVVTGASAGSMTLGVLAYHLFRGTTLDELRQALKAAWVERIEFDRLRPDSATHRTPSLFSDAIIREIATDLIDTAAWGDRAPHALFAEGMLVSFALTSMNGMTLSADGQLIRQPTSATRDSHSDPFADALQTTFHDDSIRFALFREGVPLRARVPHGARILRPWAEEDDRHEWAVFREGALASGAFPGAFPPVRLSRNRAEYASWPTEMENDSFTFDYLDGGILRNEPLREAIELAAIRDEGEQDIERIFIFIDPNVSGTRELYPLRHNRSRELQVSRDDFGEVVGMSLVSPSYIGKLTQVLGRVLGVVASQAAFRDWIRAGRVNSQIEWRDELTEILDELVPRQGSTAEARIDDLLERIYTEKEMRGVGKDAEPPSREEVRHWIAEDLNRRRLSTDSGVVGTKLALLLDLVANLREKRKLNLVAITPNSTSDGKPLPIAGDFLKNFGGFFNREYRFYDFHAGEFAASEVLHAEIDGARRLLKRDAPVAERPVAPLRDPNYSLLRWEDRKQFENLIRQHAHAAAATFGIPKIFRGFLAGMIRGRAQRMLLASETGPEAEFLVRIRVDDDKLRLRGFAGAEDEPPNDGWLSTVVSVRGTAPLSLDGHPASAFRGPHVGWAGIDGELPYLEIVEKRFWGPKTRARIDLSGGYEAWYRRTTHCAVPTVEVDLAGRSAVVCGPDDLGDESFTIE